MRANVDAALVREENRRFHDHVEAPIYDQRMGIDHGADATRRMIAELEEVLDAPLPRGGTVVDVGAGTGHVAVKLAAATPFNSVVAADISRRMLERAARSANANGCRVETVETDMVRLPFADASVDLVVGCAVLHHLPDPASFMGEVLRVLKPGAPCVFIGEPTPTGDRIIGLLKAPLLAVRRAFKPRPPDNGRSDQVDVHTFSLSDVNELTRGFDRVRVRPQGFLEPIVDSGYLALVREFLAWLPGALAITNGLRRICRTLDARVMNRVLPPSWLMSMKFSARRPD